jgi:integrase
MARRPRVSTYYRAREGYWTVRWREHGKQHEQGGYQTQDEAEDDADIIRKRVRSGIPGVRTSCTVGTLVANWFDSYVLTPAIAPATRDTYIIDARRILDHLADRDAATLSSADVRAWRDHIATTTSPRAANKAHTALSSAYQRGRETDPPLVEANPCRGISRLPEVRRAVNMPTRQHIAALEASAPAPRELAMLMIASRGALRQSELLGLRWGDADAASGGVFIRQIADLGRTIRESPKTQRSVRRVPLPPSAWAAIDAYRPATTDPSALMFPSPEDRHRPLQRTSWVRYWWQRWKLAAAWDAASRGDEWAALLDIEWKSLRHHAISRWAAAGASQAQVSRWSGDSMATIDKHYAHLFDDDEFDVMQAID